MIKSFYNSEDNAIELESYPESKWLRALSILFTGIILISTAFHFWPFSDNKIWQILYPANFVILLWITIGTCYFFIKRDQWNSILILPHVSIFAYLIINILSISFANSFGRSVNYSGKLVLIFIGGYTLLSIAISDIKSLRIVYILSITATIISVAYCLFTRYSMDSGEYGFFDNPFKYGTYVGIIVTLSASYLLTSSRKSNQLLGLVLIIGSLFSFGTIGGIFSVVIGISALSVVLRRWIAGLVTACIFLLVLGLILLLNSNPSTMAIREDFRLAEEDGINLKQRYIEWQAEINLLEERTITGTAAGCINDYRSNFYYRLPKLNTLNSFDQNGWLATGAETGIWGLVCFCWITTFYFRLAYSQIIKIKENISPYLFRFVIANFCGLIAACTSNFFCSIHYNGILIIFVLILVLISRTNMLFREKHYEN